MENKAENKADNRKQNVVSRIQFREASNPEAVEKKVKGRINWGADNLYPQDLIAYREDNPIHGGVINQKVIFMSSAGADISGMDGMEEKMAEITPAIVDDFETFNGYALIYKKVGETWKVEHVDFETVRYSSDEGWFEISDDWSHSNQSEEKTNWRRIKDISRVVLEGDEADKEVIFYSKVKPKQRKLKNGKLSLGYYPVPVYIGAKVSILAGIEQDYFTYSEAVNGYKGGTLINLANGEPATPEKADEIADQIKGEATDRDTQGGLVVTFSDGNDNAATVMSLNGNDLDKRYLESNKEIRNKIMIGHSAGSPTLFAVNGETAFGGKEEMETAYTLFSNNYVNGRQNFIASGIVWSTKRLGMKNSSYVFKKYILPFSKNDVTQMSAQGKDPILVRMGKIGIERKSCNISHSRTFDYNCTDEDFLRSVEEFATLTKEQQLILRLINDGKTFGDVSKALGKGALGLSLELIKLNSKGLLKGWKVTDPSAIELEVRYSYEVKSGMGPAVIDGTREFCRDLIELDRLYTRAEIDQLSNELDTDVWRYRGGWYHNPETGRNTPSCRHEWRQNVVRK